MNFDDDDSELKRPVYSRVTRSGYGGRNRTAVSIDHAGMLLVSQPEQQDTTRVLTANELSLVTVVCGSRPVLDLPETVHLQRSRSGSATTVFSFLDRTVTVNDLATGVENIPPALEILNDLFDTLMNWS